jgi:tRNA A37 threonylcarbamoyladenosine modification protein TsaB
VRRAGAAALQAKYSVAHNVSVMGTSSIQTALQKLMQHTAAGIVNVTAARKIVHPIICNSFLNGQNLTRKQGYNDMGEGG